VDTDILDENIISYDQMASVTASKKWLKLSRMMLHQVFKQVYLNVIQKENEVTINWNSSVKKNTKETVS
jgi:hypothetical protein